MLKITLLQRVCNIFVVMLVLISPSAQAPLCHSISPFDAVCTKFKTVFVLSAKPCVSRTTVALTIMRVDPPFFYHVESNEVGDTTIPIGKKQNVMLNIHGRLLKTQDKEKDKLHVIVKYNTTNKDVYEDVFDILFSMYPSRCEAMKHGDAGAQIMSSNGFLNQSACIKSMRLGDFSTLCYRERKEIYLTVLNICDIPYSVTVIALYPDENFEKIQKFTATKNDVAIRDETAIGGDECDLKLEFHSHGRAHEKQHVRLLYSCKSMLHNNSKDTPIVLIDDSYFTSYGMVCDWPSCIKRSSNSHDCNVTFLTTNAKELNVNISVTLHPDMCSKMVTADVTVQVEGFKQMYAGTLTGSHHLTVRENNDRKHFSVGGPNISLPVVTGYLPIDGGEISLFVHENAGKGKYHIMILRHFPLYFDAFPIIHDDFFFLSKQKPCKSKHTSVVVKVVIPIVAAILFLLAVVLIFRWWLSNKYRRRDDGLPYHIELGDDDDDDDFNERS